MTLQEITAHIRKNKLVDKTNRRMIHVDETLKAIVGTDRNMINWYELSQAMKGGGK